MAKEEVNQSELGYRPQHDLVVVKPDTTRDEKRGGLWVPEAYRSKHANDERTLFKKSDQYALGEVLAVGPGRRRLSNGEGEPLQGRVPVGVEVGQTIVYRRAEASPSGMGDGNVLVREASIVGIAIRINALEEAPIDTRCEPYDPRDVGNNATISIDVAAKGLTEA